MINMTFDEFCEKKCDKLFDPRIHEQKQAWGYKCLKAMVKNQIDPASLQEIIRWETEPTLEELVNPPELKYLRFLHVNLRPFIIEHWDEIKKLEL